MQTNAAQLWIVIGRPTRLPAALIAANSLGNHFPGGSNLLRDDSSWWKRADWQQFASTFTGIHSFRRVAACRGLFDLPRLHRDLRQRRSQIASLPLESGRGDLLLVLASVTGIANAATSAHPAAPKILCVSKTDYERLNQSPDRMHFRFTTAGWLQNRLVEPLAGLPRTLHLKPRLNPGGDGVRLVRLRQPPLEVYDRIVVMSNSGQETPDHAVGAEPRLLPSRFPSAAELSVRPDPGTDNGPRSVVFFGTPFLLVQNLSPNEYVHQLDRCLDYIRRFYPGFRWVYRPHPAETAEAGHLNLAGFELEDDREAAELYFLRRFRAIEAVYSVSSTVSRVALNNGLQAYAFWRVFPFSQTAQRFFAKTMGDVPNGFDIEDLTKPPVPSRQTQPANSHSFSDALKAAVNAID